MSASSPTPDSASRTRDEDLGRVRRGGVYPGASLHVFERNDGKWAWHLKARNGQIIATDGSQGYENRGDARAMGHAVSQGHYAPAPEVTET